MPTVAVRCPYCGAAASLAFGQTALGCDLRWWESFSCRACKTRTEADGGEDMPQEHCTVLLEHEGRGPSSPRASRRWACFEQHANVWGCRSATCLPSRRGRRGLWQRGRGARWKFSLVACVAPRAPSHQSRWSRPNQLVQQTAGHDALSGVQRLGSPAAGLSRQASWTL